MDAGGPGSGARRLDPQARELRTATIDTAPRSLGTRGGSEGCGLAGGVITKGLRSKVIEAAGLAVALNLPIPGRPIVLQEPGAKLRELVRGERLHLLLDLLDLAHQ